MSEADPPAERPRIVDLLRPARLFRGILARPVFVLPTLTLVGCAALYAQLAVGPALPRVIPELLERSFATQSELTRTFRSFILVLSLLLPVVAVVVTALASWTVLRLTRSAVPFASSLSLISHSFLWIALGFLAKAALVQITGEAEPPTNLSFFLRGAGSLERVALAGTNPFALLAAAWTVKGLRRWGVPTVRAWTGGALPWVTWIVLIALTGSGPANRFAPTTTVSYDGWGSIEGASVTVHHPPGFERQAEELSVAIDAFTQRAAEHLEFEPRHLRVNAYPDHETLERATGEFLHVQVTGSIRGTSLLFVELPGQSAAVPHETGLREAIRYAGIVQLAPVLGGAPRWFVHGSVHAAVYPGSIELERRYRAIVRRRMPAYDDLLDPRLFRTPEGPILARSLVDYIAYHHGAGTPAAIQRDLKNGIPFRDSLYSRTRLTTSALEAGWQESIRAIREPTGPPDSTRP